jgi:hypothetical protein
MLEKIRVEWLVIFFTFPNFFLSVNGGHLEFPIGTKYTRKFFFKSCVSGNPTNPIIFDAYPCCGAIHMKMCMRKNNYDPAS